MPDEVKSTGLGKRGGRTRVRATDEHNRLLRASREAVMVAELELQINHGVDMLALGGSMLRLETEYQAVHQSMKRYVFNAFKVLADSALGIKLVNGNLKNRVNAVARRTLLNQLKTPKGKDLYGALSANNSKVITACMLSKAASIHMKNLGKSKEKHARGRSVSRSSSRSTSARRTRRSRRRSSDTRRSRSRRRRSRPRSRSRSHRDRSHRDRSHRDKSRSHRERGHRERGHRDPEQERSKKSRSRSSHGDEDHRQHREEEGFREHEEDDKEGQDKDDAGQVQEGEEEQAVVTWDMLPLHKMAAFCNKQDASAAKEAGMGDVTLQMAKKYQSIVKKKLKELKGSSAGLSNVTETR